MGLFARAIERKADPLQAWFDMLRYGVSAKSGATVNLSSALKVAVAFACLRKISQGCAQVPFKLFRSAEVNGLSRISPALDHPAYDLMATAPNAWSTSYDFRESLVLHAAMGNAYVFKNRPLPRGRITELILLNPAKVEKIQRPDYSIVFKITAPNGEAKEFPSDTIWHVRGPSWDGLLGMDVLTLAREALGLAISTEETHAKLHARGVRPSGTYTVDGSLNPEQHKNLRQWIDENLAGSENAGTPLLLDRGAKWLSTTMSGLDSQHLETRKFQIEEVCRFFDVMPIMVGYSDKSATYASAEQMFLAHVVHTLSPWYARIEQSADLNLLTKEDRQSGLYFKFIAAGLMRGASKDRAEYFAKALGSGGSPPWMSQDEVRSLEELNPFGGAAAVLPTTTNAPAPAPTAD